VNSANDDRKTGVFIMTTALVAYASKMGGTQEIAEAIAQELRSAGIEVTTCDAGDVGSLEDYDAVIIGSAVYASRWRAEAVDLLARLAGSAARPRTWIFQSGPFEKVVAATEHAVPRKVHRLAGALGAPRVATFGGRIEPSTATGFIARRMAAAAGPCGSDYRDFAEIRRWAAGVAAEMAVPLTPAG
jgi:menaquinone-dependent protoporphyrinogen oxidase